MEIECLRFLTDVEAVSWPSAEGCSFSIRIAGRGWGTRHEKTSELVPIGKPPYLPWCGGFSMIHATDSEG